jgi:hypothetical protein
VEYDVVLEHCPDDSYFGYSEELDDVMATGDDRGDVLDRLKKQIHYQLEYCPCSFIDPDRLDLNVEEKEGLCER